MNARHKTSAMSRLAAGAAVMLLGSASALAQDAQPDITDSGNLYNALWAIGIFVFLLAVLGKFAWKPVLRAVQEREAHIADAVSRSEANRTRSEEMLAECDAKLRQADETAAERMAEATEAANAAKAEILAAARGEARTVARKAEAEIEAAHQSAVDELYELAAELATAAAGRIIAKQLDVDQQRRIIAESLEQIRSKAARN